jgi:hypothetical protein
MSNDTEGYLKATSHSSAEATARQRKVLSLLLWLVLTEVFAFQDAHASSFMVREAPRVVVPGTATSRCPLLVFPNNRRWSRIGSEVTMRPVAVAVSAICGKGAETSAICVVSGKRERAVCAETQVIQHRWRPTKARATPGHQ